jgi:hypothetical protein
MSDGWVGSTFPHGTSASPQDVLGSDGASRPWDGWPRAHNRVNLRPAGRLLQYLEGGTDAQSR